MAATRRAHTGGAQRPGRRLRAVVPRVPRARARARAQVPGSSRSSASGPPSSRSSPWTSCRWSRTRFRVGEERIELRTGLVKLRSLTVPRDRVRRVELTSGLLHRALGVSILTVGTGEQRGAGGDTITLDALDTAAAAELRTQLLRPTLGVAVEQPAPLPVDLPPPSAPTGPTPPPYRPLARRPRPRSGRGGVPRPLPLGLGALRPAVMVDPRGAAAGAGQCVAAGPERRGRPAPFRCRA